MRTLTQEIVLVLQVNIKLGGQYCEYRHSSKVIYELFIDVSK